MLLCKTLSETSIPFRFVQNVEFLLRHVDVCCILSHLFHFFNSKFITMANFAKKIKNILDIVPSSIVTLYYFKMVDLVNNWKEFMRDC